MTVTEMTTAARNAQKMKNTPCKESPNGRHDWKPIRDGSSPTKREKCEHCDWELSWQ